MFSVSKPDRQSEGEQKVKMIIRQDGSTYATHTEVLASLGIDIARPHREGGYYLFDKWLVWFPNLRQSGDWINRKIGNWDAIEQVYMGSEQPLRMNRDTMLDRIRITYVKVDGVYSFKGVFGNGQNDGPRIIRFGRIADECEISFEGSLI